MTPILLPFVQLEFAHAIGPEPGRYLVSDEDGEEPDVLQIDVVGAPPPREGRVLRRSRPADPDEPPREASVLRATWIGARQPLEDQLDADGRLDRLRREEAEREELIAAVLDVVNLAIRAYRAGARDPYVSEITRADPRAVRVGYGSAEQLRHGGWQAAFRPPPPRAQTVSRAERLGPTEVVSLALRGRLGLLEAEELALRVLCDLEQERPKAAAVGLRACVDLLATELRSASGARGDLPAYAESLAELEPRAATLAALALDGRLDEGGIEDVWAALDEIDRVLGAWRAPA